MDDLCESFGNEDKLAILRKRYLSGNIYTFASKMLIAINPFQTMTNLYGSEEMEKYKCKNSSAPHVYAIAYETLKNVKHGPQSVIVSGISGSGKTESTKHILDFLCDNDFDYIQLKEAIMSTAPILEAFGNASTSENRNSSRFCKYLELQYNNEFKLLGASISLQMLEINRVVSKDQVSANFNIFYAVLFGASGNLRETLLLDFDRSYVYLTAQSLKSIQLSDNVHKLNLTKIDDCFSIFGLDIAKRRQVYKIIAAILHLGNICFEESTDNTCEISKESHTSCRNAADLLSFDKNDLQSMLVNNTIDIKDTKISIPLSRMGAEKSRDNLVKTLYSNLFKNLVQIINQKTSFDTSCTSIGILDIAGFESLAHNTFDQLCINYVNEKLQQLFIQKVLLDEKQWYEIQGVDFPKIPLFNNYEVIDIFDNPSKGIFSLLNDECFLNEPSVDKFIDKVQCVWGTHKMFARTFQHTGSATIPKSFIIRHFAGSVIYSTNDFIEKNYNVVPKSMKTLATRIAALTTEMESAIEPIHKKTFRSTAQNLVSEINILITKLNHTKSNFVRCIKPNLSQRLNEFNEEMVMSQLLSSSILSYTDLISLGFPLRISIEQMDQLYACHYHLCPDEKDFHIQLLLSVGFSRVDFKFGKNHILFRFNKNDLIEKLMCVKTNIPDLQKHLLRRTSLIRKRWLFAMFMIVKSLKEKHSVVSNRILIRTQNDIGLEDVTIEKCQLITAVASPRMVPVSQQNEGPPAKSRNRKKTEKPPVNDGQMSQQIEPPANPKNRMKTEKRPLNEIRYDSTNHLPDVDNKSYGSRCKNENCNSKTHIFCSKCQVHLCLFAGRNCFRQFHTLNVKSPSIKKLS